jgi:hypothetical protein
MDRSGAVGSQTSMMRTPLTWYVLLVSICVIGPYVFGVRPRRRRDWLSVMVTLVFLTWLLAGFVSLRSR